MHAGVEQDHPDHFHEFDEVIDVKPDFACPEVHLRVPELWQTFEAALQLGQALVVADTKVVAREAVVERGGGERVAARWRHEDSVHRAGSREQVLVDVAKQRRPVLHVAVVERVVQRDEIDRVVAERPGAELLRAFCFPEQLIVVGRDHSDVPDVLTLDALADRFERVGVDVEQVQAVPKGGFENAEMRLAARPDGERPELPVERQGGRECPDDPRQVLADVGFVVAVPAPEVVFVQHGGVGAPDTRLDHGASRFGVVRLTMSS